jgi:hypothetical protein
VGRAPLGEVKRFLGRLHSKTELILILKMSEIDYLISCISFRNITPIAIRSILSIKSFFFQPLLLLHHLKSNVTDSSCSVWHLEETWSPAFRVAMSAHRLSTIDILYHCTYNCNPPSAAPYYSTVALWCCVGSVICSHDNINFDNLLNVGNVIKFRSTLNLLLLVNLTVTDQFLSR